MEPDHDPVDHEPKYPQHALHQKKPSSSSSHPTAGELERSSTLPTMPSSESSDKPSHQETEGGFGNNEATPPVKPTTLDLAGVVTHVDTSVDGQMPPLYGAQSSWSQSSERQLGQGSISSTVDPSDRVFPVRSVIAIDQSHPTPWAQGRTSDEHEYFPRRNTVSKSGRRPSNPRLQTDVAEHIRRAETLPASARSGSSPRDKSQSVVGKGKNAAPATNESQTPDAHLRKSGPVDLFSDTSSTNNSEYMNLDNSSIDATDTATGEATLAQPRETFFTTRFKHAVTEEGHAVITGRDGMLQRCEDEPIHTPGAVQSFGLLVALKEESDGRFTVRVVSENSADILGYSPQQLFKLNNFLDIFSEEQADNVLDHIDFIRDEDADPATNGPEVFSLSIRPPQARNIKLWCGMHTSVSNPDLIICEFELEDDLQNPLRPPDEMTPPIPHDSLYQNPTLEEFNESTEVSSKPLRVLRNARKKRGEAGAMQVFDMMSQIQEQLASAPDLDKFLKILVGIVKELTGFHRVMIYQFDSTYNGKVVTELVDPMQTRDLYKGLHFPASDIPKQARELYKVNKVRLLYDRDLESARLVCRTVEDLEQPLDLTHAYLRAMSPIHLKYLGNMGVRASMSISINAFSELWGLIACHSYGPRGMRVSFPIRKMCRLIGDTASRNIERLSYASRLQARKLINTVPTDKNPSGYIIASSDDLLKLFDADFGVLSIRGETKILGKIEQTQEALAMLEYLRIKQYTSVMTSQDIGEDLPDLLYPPGFRVIAGMLYVPLSVGGQDFIVFFRKGQIREVKWAGNPYDKVIKEGTANYLEPRSSFQVWHETVVGKCREWTEEQVETAAVLCLVYGKFIEVWRQKEAALQSSRLTRLLLANSAHEVRTPLNAIINYLEIALESSLDLETRENLAKSHSASKSLIYVINDLLDLTKTEEGQELIKDEILDLSECLREAIEPFMVDAKRKGVAFEVVEHVGLPRWVHGDHRRLRQAIANMTANAVEHTSKGSIKIECFVIEVAGSKVKVEIIFQDTGRGMSNKQLDALFRDLEQVTIDDEEVKSTDNAMEMSTEARTLGLGLAMVARIVRNMDGQLRLKSQQGVGSRFVIQLPFEIPTQEALDNGDTSNQSNVRSSAHSAVPSVTKSLPPTDAGEVLLIDRPTSTHNLNKSRSFDETNSVNSLRSAGSRGSGLSNKSDADRLIDAISMPLSIGEENNIPALVRRTSKGSSHSNHHSGPSVGVAHTSEKHEEGSPPPPGLSMSQPEQYETGLSFVADSKTPIKPIKVPDEYSDMPSVPQSGQSSRVLFEIPDKTSAGEKGDSTAKSAAPEVSHAMRILIAEDDPINMKILRKRLEKAGHKVSHASNGEECATIYSEKPQDFDIILMDMQMPIVDGLTSTKQIRAFEKSDKCGPLSSVAKHQGRVPILAVSASLVERELSTYVNAGFDGWILKPIDFKRLHILLAGILDDDTRNECLYAPGRWERGGWFIPRAADSSLNPMSSVATPPEEITPTGSVPQL